MLLGLSLLSLMGCSGGGGNGGSDNPPHVTKYKCFTTTDFDGDKFVDKVIATCSSEGGNETLDSFWQGWGVPK